MKSLRRHWPVALIFIYLAGLAGWVVHERQKNYYADLFNEPRLDDPTEVTRMQQAFADIVARRNLQTPLEQQQEIARIFHGLDIWQNMWFLGIPIQKNPCDLWMMQQIIYETKPDLIVETGTFRGGSALCFAHVLSGLGLAASQVVTIDIEDAHDDAAGYPAWQQHVRFIHGSSTDPDVVAEVRRLATGRRVLVVLDSVHEKDHVLNELEAYAPLVSPGSYVVVEDTNSDGVPVFPGSIGPTAAVREFLATPGGQHSGRMPAVRRWSSPSILAVGRSARSERILGSEPVSRLLILVRVFPCWSRSLERTSLERAAHSRDPATSVGWRYWRKKPSSQTGT